MKEWYGDEVNVDYVDLSDPEKYDQYKEIAEEVAATNWPYPIVAINGTKLIRGTNFGVISNYIDTLKKAEQKV